MNWYKRHIGDYIKDCAHLSLIEHGVYSRLLDVYYTRESGIPDDQAARLVGARSKEERAALKAVLSEFFQLKEGIWTQARCEEEISAASEVATTNREIALQREAKKRAEKEAREKHEPTTNRAQSVQRSDHEPTTSQTPDSISHKPDTSKNQEQLAIARAWPGLEIDQFDRWIEYRKQRKPAIKPASYLALAKELTSFAEQQATVVQHSIANGYQGLFPPKTNGASVTTLKPRTTRFEQAMQALGDTGDESIKF